MLWLLFRYSVFATFLLLALWFTIRHKHLELLCLYFWAIAFANCFVFAITIWTPAKVVSLFMLWCVLSHKKERPPENRTLYDTFFTLYLIMVILGNVAAVLSQFDVLVTKGSPFVRIVLQDFTYISAGILLFYGRLLKPGFAPRLFHSYAICVEVAILVALVHLVFNAAGLSFMPIMRAVEHNASFEDASLSVKATFGGEKVLRVYAFAGEPKNLGFLIVPYLLMSITCYVNGKIRRSRFYHLAMLLLGTFILVETFSSSAIIALILSLPVLLIYVLNGTNRKGFLIVFACMLLATPFAVKKTFGPDALSVVDDKEFATALFERTFERGYNELSNGRQEVDIFEAYLDGGPMVMLFGWGVGQYTFHVEDSFTQDGALKTVQSGVVLALADFGLVGILMYLLLSVILVRCVAHSLRSPSTYEKIYSLGAVSMYMGSLMYGSIYSCFIFLMVAHYIRLMRIEKYGDSDSYNQYRPVKRRSFA